MYSAQDSENDPEGNLPPLIVGQPLLVIVDVQRDWVIAPGHGGIVDVGAIPTAIERIEQVVTAARSIKMPIVFSQEVHRPSGVDYGREIDHGEPLRCIEGVEATQLWPTLVPTDDEYHITKRRCSCFFGTELDILLRSLNTTTILLVGGLTDICVHYTFVDAFQRDFYVRIVEDAVVGSTLARHDAALDAMEHLHHGSRRSADEVCSTLGTSTRPQIFVPPGGSQ